MGHSEGFRDFCGEEVTVGNSGYLFNDKSENYAAGVAVFGLLPRFKVQGLPGNGGNNLLGSPVFPLVALERLDIRDILDAGSVLKELFERNFVPPRILGKVLRDPCLLYTSDAADE